MKKVTRSVSFDRKSVKTIEKEIQTLLDNLENEEIDLRTILPIGTRGLLFLGAKKEVTSGNPIMDLLRSGQAVAIPLPPEEVQRVAPSEDTHLIMSTVLRGLGEGDVKSDHKKLPDIAKKAINGLPGFRVKAVAEELARLATEHRTECSDTKCRMLHIYEMLSSQLQSDASINIQ